MYVFICFATKAMHLELVSELSTAIFLGALKRFMAKREKVLNIYSDNATNFIGSKYELIELKRLFNRQEHKEQLEAFLTEESITWHIIPTKSPNFGGLWQAAVKSMTYHLHRVATNISH